jgi:hypothetical protein
LVAFGIRTLRHFIKYIHEEYKIQRMNKSVACSSCVNERKYGVQSLPLYPPHLFSIVQRCYSTNGHNRQKRPRIGWWSLAFILLSLLVAHRTFVEYRHYGFGISNNHSKATTVPKEKPHVSHVHYVATIPVDVQLSGEFGNHLSKIATAIAVAYELQQRSSSSKFSQSFTNTTMTLEFRADLRLRRQEGTKKGAAAVEILNECFSTLVRAIMTNEYTSATTKTKSSTRTGTRNVSAPLRLNVLPPLRNVDAAAAPFDGINSENITVFDATLDDIVAHARQSVLDVTSNRTGAAAAAEAGTTIHATTPFVLHSNRMVHMDTFPDRYYALYQALYALDTSCCGRLQPDDDEVVFYLRAFTTEMPRRGVVLGFEELSPQPLVRALSEYYPHTESTSRIKKIALLSRFASRHDVMDPCVTALQNDGWTVRVMVNQSAMQDFCFLQRTSLHLMGPARSTFFKWAALLSGGQDNDTVRRRRRTVTAYSMDTPARRAAAAKSQEPLLESILFTNPVLQREWEFRLYNNTLP